MPETPKPLIHQFFSRLFKYKTAKAFCVLVVIFICGSVPFIPLAPIGPIVATLGSSILMAIFVHVTFFCLAIDILRHCKSRMWLILPALPYLATVGYYAYDRYQIHQLATSFKEQTYYNGKPFDPTTQDLHITNEHGKPDYWRSKFLVQLYETSRLIVKNKNSPDTFHGIYKINERTCNELNTRIKVTGKGSKNLPYKVDRYFRTNKIKHVGSNANKYCSLTPNNVRPKPVLVHVFSPNGKVSERDRREKTSSTRFVIEKNGEQIGQFFVVNSEIAGLFPMPSIRCYSAPTSFGFKCRYKIYPFKKDIEAMHLPNGQMIEGTQRDKSRIANAIASVLSLKEYSPNQIKEFQENPETKALVHRLLNLPEAARF